MRKIIIEGFMNRYDPGRERCVTTPVTEEHGYPDTPVTEWDGDRPSVDKVTLKYLLDASGCDVFTAIRVERQ